MAHAAPLLLVVDGSSLLHRAHHALPALTAPDGRLVSAAYGFLMMFFKAIADLRPTHVAVAFDLPGGTFRNALFPAYQAQREAQPDELYAQIPIIKELLAALRVPVVEVEGFEADDAIGTIVDRSRQPIADGRKHRAAQTRVKISPTPSSQLPTPNITILSGDKDLLQLVRDGVEVVLLRRGMTDVARYDTAAVVARFRFPPERIPDFKALAGDPSDNYPGVPGIGEKTATELVRRLGSVEEILKSVERRGGATSPPDGRARRPAPTAQRDDSISEKLATKLREHAGNARLGLKLSTIVRDVPIAFDLAACARGAYDRDAVVAKLRALGFTSLIGRLPTLTPSHSHSQEGGGEKENFPPSHGEGGQRVPRSLGEVEGGVGTSIETPSSASTVRAAFTDARRAGTIAIAVVADGDDPRRGHSRALGMAFGDRAVGCSPWGTALAEGASLLRDPAVAKDAHGAKSVLHALRRSRVDLAGLRYDTELLSYLLAPGNRSHDLAHVAFAALGTEIHSPGVILSTAKDPVESVQRDASGDTLSMTLEEGRYAAAKRAGREATIVAQLVPALLEKVEDAGLTRVYEEFDRPLVAVLQRMEEVGVHLDVAHLTALGARMSAVLAVADRAIYRAAGEEFNIDSPRQLTRILFEVLGLAARGMKKTAKGGGLSTAASELEKLRGSHPIIEHLFTHRELGKLLSTYVSALPALVDPVTGRVHTTYHQTVTATGRLSSSDPNLQNIPVTEPWGPEIRRAFTAEDGWQLLALDYSQFELRIAAALSGDRALTAAFRAGADIHAATGAEVFGVAPGDVTRDQRRVAKAINFGILYGMGAGSLAATAAVSREEAEAYIQRYFQAYEELHEWIEATKALARKRSYVETLFGRKRFLPEMTSGVPQVRAAAERMAVNMPIQGTQADLLKMAMIRADEWIRSRGQGSVPTLRSGSRHGVVGSVRGQGSDAVRMVLTVHDELIFEVREAFVAEAAVALTDILEHVHDFPVPIVVEAKAGPNWTDLTRVRV